MEEEEDLHVVKSSGETGEEGGGITTVPFVPLGGRERRKKNEIPRIAHGRERDGARANEREGIYAQCPLHTMRMFSCRFQNLGF